MPKTKKNSVEARLIRSMEQAVQIARNQVVQIETTQYVILKFSDVIDAPSTRGTKYWQGFVVSDATTGFYTCTLSWSTTKTGISKQKWSVPFYAKPTNVGRANERNNEAQAFFDFDSMVKKEMDKRKSEKPLPMLAQKFEERKEHIIYPCAVQPKFDGMRCLYDGKEPWSRGGKPIADGVFDHLHFDTQGYIVDGELILPGNVKVNKTMEAAKKFYPGISDTLLYRIYDIVDETLTFAQRYEILNKLASSITNNFIVLVETHKVTSEAQIMKSHVIFTQKGYEGTIIRNLKGLYTINKRTNDLQKFKDFVDEEFLIVDIIPSGGGIAETVGKFVLQDNQSDETFESTAMGSLEEREEYLRNKHKYIRKYYAKTKFRERSGKNNVPFHSNVLELRKTKDGGY